MLTMRCCRKSLGFKIMKPFCFGTYDEVLAYVQEGCGCSEQMAYRLLNLVGRDGLSEEDEGLYALWVPVATIDDVCKALTALGEVIDALEPPAVIEHSFDEEFPF